MSNYINKVAKMLNLALGQEFTVTDIAGKVFWFTKATLMSIDENHNTGCANHKILGMILDGTVAINILPPIAKMVSHVIVVQSVGLIGLFVLKA